MSDSVVRAAGVDDLDAINRVVAAAFGTWKLPQRVKRLSLPSYQYDQMDLRHLEVVIAECSGEVVAVAAWEAANPADCPEHSRGLLLHGLYVLPSHMRQGIGTRLLAAARDAARAQGYHGVLVRAQADAVGFFQRAGLQALPVEDATRHYAARLWWAV